MKTPDGYISPEMKFFPFAIPVIIVRSSVGEHDMHFNKVVIPNYYGYYNFPDYKKNSKKFKWVLMNKFQNGNKLFNDQIHTIDADYISEHVIYPRYIDPGFSSVDDFIEYNAQRIYEGTMKVNDYIHQKHNKSI